MTEPPNMPCPFCGGAKTENCHDDGLHWVRCKSCGSTGPAHTRYADPDDEDFVDWNSRVGQTALVAERDRLKFYLQKIATGTGDNPTWAVEQAKEALSK